MSVHATCPKCGEQFRRPDGLAGKLEKCPECKFVFKLPFPVALEPPKSPAPSQPQSSPQDTRQDASDVPSAPTTADDDSDLLSDDPAGWNDASDADQEWPRPPDAEPLAADARPQYASQGRRGRSSLGRKFAFGVSVIVLIAVSGAIAMIWASSKSDEASPKGRVSNQASSKSAKKTDASGTGAEKPQSDKRPEAGRTGADKASEVSQKPDVFKGA
jgi:hypothetical protein